MIPGASASGGYLYRMSTEEITNGTKQGCRWCELLNKCLASSIRLPTSSLFPRPVPLPENIVEVRVGYIDSAKNRLGVFVNGIEGYLSGYVYTAEGARIRFGSIMGIFL